MERVPAKGRVRMMNSKTIEPKSKEKREKYVPPKLVDYGSVKKITAAPKQVSGPDHIGSIKKGSCL